MHHAPAVSFPLGRSHFLGGLLAIAWAVGVGVVVAWVLVQQRLGWPQGLGIGAVCLCGVLAGNWWKSHPVGRLAWDGQGWQVRFQGATLTGCVSVHLDLQHHLLLKVCGSGRGAATWLWLDERADPSVWGDVRRAVYSRARKPSAADSVPGSMPP